MLLRPLLRRTDMSEMDETMDAVWCVDSETGKKVLIDRKTNKVITTGEQLEKPKLLYAFSMSIETAQEFYRRVQQYEALTEEDRNAILIQMVQEGLITDLTVTERSKEQYISDLAKNFRVLELKKMEDTYDETQE